MNHYDRFDRVLTIKDASSIKRWLTYLLSYIFFIERMWKYLEKMGKFSIWKMSHSFASFLFFSCHVPHTFFGSSDISDPLGCHETMITIFNAEAKTYKRNNTFYLTLIWLKYKNQTRSCYYFWDVKISLVILSEFAWTWTYNNIRWLVCEYVC